MIIKEIRLENIRSHANSLIDLKEGINFIHGDIGAGKSSILYAIEFALFGTGSRFGKNEIKLLRAGEKSGFVEVEIRTAGKDYLFHREIKEGHDKGGWIIEDGVKEQLSASELRREGLEILKLREPKSSRSRSYIYEYAIFTPQEEMKRILEDRPEDRMKLLRKAFGLTDYANARDNCGIIIDAFKSESRALNGVIEEMRPKRSELSEVQRELEERNREEKSVLGELEGVKKRYEKLKYRVEELERKDKELQEARITLYGKRKERESLLVEIERLEKDLQRIKDLKERLKALEKDYARYSELDVIISEEHSKRAEKDSYSRRARDLEKRIKDITEEIFKYRKEVSEDLSEKIEALKKEISALAVDEKSEKNTKEMASVVRDLELLNRKLRELDDEEKGYSELSGQKYCPKCGQPLTEAHVQNLLSKIQKEGEDTEHRVEELLRKKEELENEKRKIEEERNLLKEKERELRQDLSDQSAKERVKEIMLRREEEKGKLESELSEVSAKLDSIALMDIKALEEERDKLKPIYEEYIRAKGETEREEDMEKELSSKKERIKGLVDEETTLEERIKVLEPGSNELKALRDEEKKIVGRISALEERLRNIRERIEENEERIEDLQKSIEKLQRKEERVSKIKDAIEWLEGFSRGMETIERSVVNFLNQEFQSKFQELFSMLIDDEITVEVD
ncbi:MAG: AAA family ATPase, partial [Candidatus Thermoplasmatota archaeon]|nr:AAA family ATPase [Candidatus Thermoplasmatota archaeon]